MFTAFSDATIARHDQQLAGRVRRPAIKLLIIRNSISASQTRCEYNQPRYKKIAKNINDNERVESEIYCMTEDTNDCVWQKRESHPEEGRCHRIV